MKKINLLLSAALVAVIGMTSCQESQEKKDRAIADKIECNEALSSEDYSRIISYVGEYAEKAQKYVDMQINNEDVEEANTEMATLKEEYPLVDTFRDCLRATSLESLSPEDIEQIGKYAGLVEFSAPAGYTIQTNGPEDAGLEVASPDSVNGVIAGAVDTLEVKR